MTNLPKYVQVLLVIAILGSIFGLWAWGLNNFAGVLEKNRATQVINGLEECVHFGAPHALVADGEVYCYLVYNGSEKMIPLETLKERENQERSDSPQ